VVVHTVDAFLVPSQPLISPETLILYGVGDGVSSPCNRSVQGKRVNIGIAVEMVLNFHFMPSSVGGCVVCSIRPHF